MPDAAVAHAPPPASRRVAAIWRRHVRVYGRAFWSNATPAVLEPVLLLLSVGLGVGKHVASTFNGLPYDAYMAPGILATASLYTASFEATYGTFIRMRFQGTYEAVLASPATVRDVVVAELLWCGSKGVLYATIVGLVLFALGFAHGWALLAVPVLGFVTALAFAGLGLLVTSRLKSIDHLQVYFTVALTPMVFFSGFVFPVDQLPPAIAAVARALPMFHAVESFRIVCTGTAHASAPWTVWCPAILTVYAAALSFAGGWAFRRRILRER